MPTAGAGWLSHLIGVDQQPPVAAARSGHVRQSAAAECASPVRTDVCAAPDHGWSTVDSLGRDSVAVIRTITPRRTCKSPVWTSIRTLLSPRCFRKVRSTMSARSLSGRSVVEVGLPECGVLVSKVPNDNSPNSRCCCELHFRNHRFGVFEPDCVVLSRQGVSEPGRFRCAVPVHVGMMLRRESGGRGGA